VTDLDAAVAEGEGVEAAAVFEALARNVQRLRRLVLTAVDTLPDTRSRRCATALDGMDLPFEPPRLERPVPRPALQRFREVTHAPQTPARPHPRSR
jgi:hypothetical protein